MHKAVILILASCILITFSCKREKPKNDVTQEKVISQSDSTELLKKPSGTIIGKVIDKSCNLPLPAASIEIIDTKMNTAADKEGNYSLQGIAPGVYNVVARFIAYYPDTAKDVNVEKDKTIVVDFELKEYIPELKPHETK